MESSGNVGRLPHFASELTPSASKAANGRRMTRLRAERVLARTLRLPTCGEMTKAPEKVGEPAIGLGASSRLLGSQARLVGSIPTHTSSSHDYYLQQSGVKFLLEDLVKKLQEDRPEQVSAFISTYFANVVKGAHIRGREFEYINGALINRVAFLGHLERCFSNTELQNLELTNEDFAELMWCQCRDVPSILLEQASSHLTEASDGFVRAHLSDFVGAFRACYLYNEFLNKVFDIYAELLATRDNRVASPRGQTRSESVANAMAADRVVARLRLIAQQNTFLIPPLGDVESFVFKSSSFKEFCGHFFTSAAIASAIDELQDAMTHLRTHV